MSYPVIFAKQTLHCDTYEQRKHIECLNRFGAAWKASDLTRLPKRLRHIPVLSDVVQDWTDMGTQFDRVHSLALRTPLSSSNPGLRLIAALAIPDIIKNLSGMGKTIYWNSYKFLGKINSCLTQFETKMIELTRPDITTDPTKELMDTQVLIEVAEKLYRIFTITLGHSLISAEVVIKDVSATAPPTAAAARKQKLKRPPISKPAAASTPPEAAALMPVEEPSSSESDEEPADASPPENRELQAFNKSIQSLQNAYHKAKRICIARRVSAFTASNPLEAFKRRAREFATRGTTDPYSRDEVFAAHYIPINTLGTVLDNEYGTDMPTRDGKIFRSCLVNCNGTFRILEAVIDEASILYHYCARLPKEGELEELLREYLPIDTTLTPTLFKVAGHKFHTDDAGHRYFTSDLPDSPRMIIYKRRPIIEGAAASK